MKRTHFPTSIIFVLALLLALPMFGAVAVRSQDATPAATPAAELAPPDDYDAATRDDPEFNALFRHEFAPVDDVLMHYVIGGEGPPLVLLHGWPQTWYEWIDVMPALASEFTVVAIDLPGLGDSVGKPSGYDKATLARYVHDLVAGHLGYEEINLVTHDLGAGVGYQYAAQFPDEVRRWVFMDYVLPGPATPETGPLSISWHFGFHAAEDGLAEDLVTGQEREYIAWYFDNFAAAPGLISAEAIDEFARTYSRPDNLNAGFELYRALPQDAEDNNRSAARPLTMPVLVLAATRGPGGETGPDFNLATVLPVAPDAQLVPVPDSGHWLAEEQPEFVTQELLGFLR